MAKKTAKNKPVKTQALVVYQPPKKSAKKNKNKRNGSITASAAYVSAYRAALCDPFSPAATGARVPDMYCVPTATRHITKSITLTTNASGECDLVVLPSAFYHAISSRGSIVGGSTWTTSDGGANTNSLVYTVPSTLSSTLTNYRIVGYGVKVMGISALSSASGKVLGATLPIASWVNSKDTVGLQSGNVTDTSGTVPNTLAAYGLPISSGKIDISAIPMYSNSMEASLTRVTETPIAVVPKIASPEAFDFRLSADSAVGYNITDQTSTSFVTAGDASYLRLAGHEEVLIAVTGAPPSTSVLEVEVIYHLEGNPRLGSGVAIAADATVTVCEPQGFVKAVQSVAKMPAFKIAVETVGNSLIPGLGSLASRFF